MSIVPWRASLALAYMAGIVFLSSLTATQLAQLGIPALLADLGHVGLFAGLAAVTLWSLVGPPPRCALVAILVCCLFALADEWHQRFVPGRAPSLEDVVSDLVGVLLGVALVAGIAAGWRALAGRAGIARGGLEP